MPAPEGSEWDLVISDDDPGRLIDSTEWIHQFGSVLLTTVKSTAVLGAGIGASCTRAAKMSISILGRGSEILLDKDGQLAKLAASFGSGPGALPKPASEDEFHATVADFWYHVLWIAEKLRRGKLLSAK